MKISFFVLFRSSFNWLGFPGGSDGKASAWNAGDQGSIPGSGRSPGEGNGNPLQHSYLENPMDEGAWLIGYSPWGHKQSDTTERLHLGFSMYDIMSSANWEFYYFSDLDSFYFFFFSKCYRTSQTMLNNSGESGHPCLVLLISGGMFSVFHHWK